MKRLLITFGLIVVLAGAFVFYNKLYYPTLPIETISKKEVIEKLNKSDEKILKLTSENGKEWYIVNEQNQSIVDEIIIDMLSQKEWVFKRKDGSGLFFEKQGEDLIITTQKWTGDYSLINIPMKFDE
ncbi:hypothetical protein [Metalysinibacillus jejuensis]|uniref:hypothetical protein n=1 Tax=Metalysinibacillus jejuensis TaxID=914327 RepID=UPI000D36C542|nr:hypothetical protein [Metalysinibacillus jejuensis]